MSVAKIKPFG